MFQVKKGNPPTQRKLNSKYPFGQMEPGTYFEVPADHPGAELNKFRQSRVAGSAYSYGMRHNMRFQIRRQESGAVHVYRTE